MTEKKKLLSENIGLFSPPAFGCTQTPGLKTRLQVTAYTVPMMSPLCNTAARVVKFAIINVQNRVT